MKKNVGWQRFPFRYLIYPRFQLPLLLVNLLILVGFMGGAAYLVRRSFKKFLEIGPDIGLPANHLYFKFVAEQSDLIFQRLLYSIGLATFLSALVILVLSHRLAGPLVRMRRYLWEVSRGGKIYDIKFRKNDFFDDLPESLNAALKYVGQKGQDSSPNISRKN